MTDAQPTNASPKPDKLPKGRSPNYPGVSLAKAVERVREIYEKTKTYPVPVRKIIVDYWGYKTTTTGPASVTYAALKRYGLLQDEGVGDDRIAHVSELAVDILHPNPAQDEAIKKAALAPSIIREWWDKYGLEVPPTDSLNYELVVKGPWTENGLADFLRVYRETISFAELSKSDKIDRVDAEVPGTDYEGDDDGGDTDDAPPPPRLGGRFRKPQATGMKTYAIPVDADHDAVIELPVPMTQERWNNFKSLLEAMERVIVDDRPTQDDSTIQ